MFACVAEVETTQHFLRYQFYPTQRSEFFRLKPFTTTSGNHRLWLKSKRQVKSHWSVPAG